MYGKCIIFSVFLAFMALQLAQAKDNNLITPRPSQNNTKCFSCNSPSSCRSPSSVTCDQKMANATRSALAKYFSNVSNLTNTEFECLKTSYTFKNSTVIAIKGCINAGVNACGLRPLNTSYATSQCKSCKKNLCNPAGTFSSSSVLLLSSVFGLLLLKCGNF